MIAPTSSYRLGLQALVIRSPKPTDPKSMTRAMARGAVSIVSFPSGFTQSRLMVMKSVSGSVSKRDLTFPVTSRPSSEIGNLTGSPPMAVL